MVHMIWYMVNGHGKYLGLKGVQSLKMGSSCGARLLLGPHAASLLGKARDLFERPW